MISTPPPEVALLKTKAEEESKDEPASKKIKVESSSPSPMNTSTTISVTVSLYCQIGFSDQTVKNLKKNFDFGFNKVFSAFRGQGFSH